MSPSIFERIQAKLELFRLEKRYTRHRHRRSTFVSNAIYVDGEYVYQTPNTTGSSNTSHDSTQTGGSSPAYGSSSYAHSPTTPTVSKEQKKMNRFSSMPGFGMTNNRDVQPAEDWRAQRASYDGTR